MERAETAQPGEKVYKYLMEGAKKVKPGSSQ